MSFSTSPLYQKMWGIQPVTGSGDDYPLVQAACRYGLVDVYLSAELSHTFTSRAEYQSDVTYVFPLPPDASVHAFKALIDNHLVEGVVKEKAEARATFEAAVSMNQKAALLQQENVEIFKLMLGNVNPGQTITVHISFISLISHEGINDNLRLTFPTSIAPRYGTPPGGSFYQANSLSRSSTLEFSLSVEVGATITTINSPSHPISSQLGRSGPDDEGFDVQKAYISLSSTGFLDKDIVIVLSCRGLDKQRCVVESHVAENGQATDAYALTFVPRFKLPPLPRQEYIFLVDRSGSMEGGKMHAVRSALQIMLKSLPNNGSSFNLISFGSHQSALWPKSTPYTAANVQAASGHVDDMIANYGGTEMKLALATAFTSRLSHGSGENIPASVFVLTDGQCYDLDGVQAEIRNHVAQAKARGTFLRVFCMGIGDAVSKGMCNVIARAGNGAAVFVGEMEKPDQKLMSLIRAASGPPVENLTIDWGINDSQSLSFGMDQDEEDMVHRGPSEGAPLSMFDEEYDFTKDMQDLGTARAGVQQYPPPNLMSTLLPGFRVSFYAIATRPAVSNMERSCVVKLSGTVQGQPMHLEAPVSPITPVTSGTGISAKLIHLIAARSLIQGHEDQLPLTDQSKQEILRLGLHYSLASSQTSFVAVDEIGQPKSLLFDHEPTMYGVPKAYGMSPPGAPSPMVARARTQASLGVQGHGGSALFGKSATVPSPSSLKFGQPPQMAQLPGSAHSSPPSWSSGSETMASPALSELSLHPQQHPSIQRYLAGEDEVVMSPISEYSPAFAGSAGTFGSPGGPPMYGGASAFGASPARPPVPPPLNFSRRGIKKKQSSGDSYISASTRSPTTAVDRTLTSSVESLAREQAFDGSFKPTQALFKLLTGELLPPPMSPSLKDIEIDENIRNVIWCTLLVVAYLQVNFAEEQGAWSILSEKATTWVKTTLVSHGVPENKVDNMLEKSEDAKAAVLKK